MSKASDNEKAAVGLATLATMPILFVFRGYVTVDLWAWFVVPLGGPMIGMWHAMGLVGLAQVPLAPLGNGVGRLNKMANDRLGIDPWPLFWEGRLASVLTTLLFWGWGALMNGLMT